MKWHRHLLTGDLLAVAGRHHLLEELLADESATPRQLEERVRRLKIEWAQDDLLELLLLASERLEPLLCCDPPKCSTTSSILATKLESIIEGCLAGEDHRIRGNVRAIKHELGRTNRVQSEEQFLDVNDPGR